MWGASIELQISREEPGRPGKQPVQRSQGGTYQTPSRSTKEASYMADTSCTTVNGAVRTKVKFCLCHLPALWSLAHCLMSLSLYLSIYNMRFEYLFQGIICPKVLKQFIAVVSEARVCRWCFSRIGTTVGFLSSSDPYSYIGPSSCTEPVPELQRGGRGSKEVGLAGIEGLLGDKKGWER